MPSVKTKAADLKCSSRLGELVKVAREARSLRVGGSSRTSASPAVGAGYEDRSQTRTVNLVGEDQVAGGQVDLHIFFVEVQIDHTIALGGVQ